MQDRGLRSNIDRRLTAGSSSSDQHTPILEIPRHVFLSPAPHATSSALSRGHSPHDIDPSSLVGLGISSSGGPSRRASSTPSSRADPGPSTSAGRTSPPYAKKKSKDDKPAGKDMRRSCAECRRLKAKCDRVFPCSNCRRRGCALVCPDGDLGCMQGKRLVLASTEQLHERIAQLETALFQVNSKVSAAPHPLLAPEFLDGGFASQPQPSTSYVQPLDAFGQTSDILEGLALSENLAYGSDVDYVAEAAATDSFLPANFRPDAAPRTAVMIRLRGILDARPSREKAREIADRFFLECEWFNFILHREEYDALYEPSVYAPTEHNPLSLHKLACVLIVCALQLYLDPARDFDAVDGKVALYWDAAQQCFDTRYGWAATVPGVQALALMTWFVSFAPKGGGDVGNGSTGLYWLRRMTAACEELQLNKEPHPCLSLGEANFRRRVFWEATAVDCVVSLSHNHYTGIPIEQVEVRYPSDVPQWAIMRYEYIRTVSYPAIELGLRPDSNQLSSHEILGLEELLAHYQPEAQPAIHCPYLVGEPLPELSASPLFDVSAIQRSSVSMTLYQSYLIVYKSSLRRIVDRIRTNPDTELSSWDRHIVMRAFETSQKIIRIARFMQRTMPRINARHTSLWNKLFGATVTIAAAAIWCGPHMTPSFVGQIVVELNEIAHLASETSGFNASSDRPLAVNNIVTVFQSMVVGRYPQVVGEDPGRVTASIAREDMLFALLGGTVDSVSGDGMQSALDWSQALAATPGVPSSSSAWALHTSSHMFDSPRRDFTPAVLHTPGHDGMPTSASSFTGTASPFGLGGQGYFDYSSGVSPHQASPPQGSAPSRGIMPQSVFADTPMMEPPHTAGGAVGSELWSRLQTMYTPNPWWGVSNEPAGHQQYISGSMSTTSAPASLSTGMSLSMPVSRPTSAPYIGARVPSPSPAPAVPRVMSVPAPLPMAQPQPQMHDHDMLPPPMFHDSR